MPETARLRLEVELERGGDQIRGTVADGIGPVLEFAGWLELMSAFDTARARADDSTGGSACAG